MMAQIAASSASTAWWLPERAFSRRAPQLWNIEPLTASPWTTGNTVSVGVFGRRDPSPPNAEMGNTVSVRVFGRRDPSPPNAEIINESLAREVTPPPNQGHKAPLLSGQPNEIEAVNSASVPSDPEITWEKGVQDRLNNIRALPVGWDGYRGRPTRSDVMEFAVHLLYHVCKPRTPPPAIVPLPSGGLQIEWHAPNVTIELTIRAPLAVEAWVADPRTQDDGTEWTLTTDFAVIVPWVHNVGGEIADHTPA